MARDVRLSVGPAFIFNLMQYMVHLFLALMQLWLISSASTRLAYVLAVLSERWLFTVVHFRLAKGVWIEILSIENLTARAQTAPNFVQKLRR